MSERFVLDATNKSITAVMSGAAATTNPDFEATWADKTTTTFTPGGTDGAFNGTTPVTLVAAPSASTQRTVYSINIYNRDTDAVTITLRYLNGASTRIIKVITLAVGDQYTLDGTYDDDGQLKTSAVGGSGAPTDATYITQTANGSLSAEQALASLSTGLMKVTTTTGVVSSVTDSAGLAGCISDETGSGALVFGTSPSLSTPRIDGIDDSNGNLVEQFFTTASAVNYITNTNAATGAGPELATAGGDTNIDFLLAAKGSGVVKADGVEVVTLSGTQTLTNKTLTAPTIADFTNAVHDHQDNDDGGGLDAAAIQAGTLVLARGGTGVSAASNTALFDAIDPLTTKGDIITHDGTNTVRQAIGGTNGHVATVNSSATNGWEWAAASGSGAMTQLVAWTVLGSDQASVSMSSISGSYSHLLLTIRVRTDHSASDDALVRFNADTTAGNYYGVFAYVTQTTTGAVSNAGSVATITPIGGWVSANTATASYYTDYFIWIMDYTSTSRFKIFNMLSLVPITTTNFNHVTGGGHWLNSANAITAISIAPRNGSNLKAGTGYGLWGIV